MWLVQRVSYGGERGALTDLLTWSTVGDGSDATVAGYGAAITEQRRPVPVGDFDCSVRRYLSAKSIALTLEGQGDDAREKVALLQTG